MLKGFWTTAVSTAVLAAAIPSAAMAQSTEVYRVDLKPLNNSSVEGHATLQLRDDKLTVIINARGLVPNEPHLGHIHGTFESGEPTDAICPPPEAAGSDGVLTVTEGAPFYGPIILPFDFDDQDIKNGVLTFKATYDLSNEQVFAADFTKDDLLPLPFREIVLHGGFVNGDYVLSLPVACGDITQQSGRKGPKVVEF